MRYVYGIYTSHFTHASTPSLRYEDAWYALLAAPVTARLLSLARFLCTASTFSLQPPIRWGMIADIAGSVAFPPCFFFEMFLYHPRRSFKAVGKALSTSRRAFRCQVSGSKWPLPKTDPINLGWYKYCDGFSYRMNILRVACTRFNPKVARSRFHCSLCRLGNVCLW